MLIYLDFIRDYIYVDDVVRSMVAAATAPDINQNVINIGSGKETSVREIAEMTQKLTGDNAELLYTPRSDSGVSRLCADITLAKKKLKFTPKIKLQEGLEKTLSEDPRFKI